MIAFTACVGSNKIIVQLCFEVLIKLGAVVFMKFQFIINIFYFNPSLAISISFFALLTESFSPFFKTTYPPSVRKNWEIY